MPESITTPLVPVQTLRRAARPPNPRLSVVIPARNEARNLEVILPELPPVHEVLLIDGSSNDDTVATAQRVLPGIRIIHQTRRGKGNALACGFEAATGDIVVMFDADGSADPTEIPRFVEALVAGADFAKGSRFCNAGGSEDITVIRRAGNKFLNTTTNVSFSTSYTDLCYGYNAFWRDVLPVLDLPATDSPAPADGMLWGDGFEIETMINCRVVVGGLSVVEVPSVERSRIHGESNLNSVRDGIRVLRTIMTERRRSARLSRTSRAARTDGSVPPAVSVIDLRRRRTQRTDVPVAPQYLEDLA